ncbi:hypothetical protein [Pararhodospirillum photometricum]|nr:hypothetical protein [Pararhodospirillum photometricum]
MSRTLPYAALAGLAGVLMFAAFLYVPVLGALIMQASVLPLLVVGLRFGAASALAAAIVATGAALVFLPWAMVPVQVLLDGVPAVLVCALALRSAPGLGRGALPAEGAAAWYPAGHVLAWLSAAALGLLALFALGVPTGEASLEAVVAGAVHDALTSVLAEAPVEARAQVLAAMPAYLPGVFLATWVTRITLCAMLAQALLARRKVASRPTPVYSALDLPSWQVGLFLAALAGGVGLGGDAGYLAANAAFGLAMPLVAMGLVLVHQAARLLPHPGVALGAFYGLMVLGSTAALAAVAGLGVVEVMIKRRGPQGLA